MTNEELLAMLTATVDRDAIDFDPTDEDALYIDWSTTSEGGRSFEFGAAGEAVNFDLTWNQIARLQQALTVLLLESPK
jgi:hypothetical protein